MGKMTPVYLLVRNSEQNTLISSSDLTRRLTDVYFVMRATTLCGDSYVEKRDTLKELLNTHHT